METTYTNLNGSLLKPQQVKLEGTYVKILKQNDRLRKEEFYEENILFNTLNYIEFGSSHQDLLASNPESVNIVEIEDFDSNYTKYHSFKYYNGILKSKGLAVRKINDVGIMTQTIDLQTNLALYNKTFKYYHETNGYEFKFSYYHSGELALIIVSNDSISFYEQYKFNELNLIPNFEWWNQYSSYYLNAEPAVPDGIIIA